MKRGFTLVEMIVTLVIAGMVGIGAVAGIRAVMGGAENVSALNTIDRVVLVERSWAANNEGYFTLEALDEKLDRDLSYTTGVSGGVSEASVRVDTEGSLFVAVLDGDNNCHAVKVLSPSRGGEQTTLTPNGSCSAENLV